MNHSFTIDRLFCDCAMPRDQIVDIGSRHRLHDVAEQYVPQALADLLEPLCGAQDDGVWLIRRLEISFHANLAWDSSKLTSRWAGALAKAILHVTQREWDSRVAFYYRSRAEYIAAFVSDLADGMAWNKWQYQLFSGLRPLPTSAVLRTLLVTETANALGGLALLLAASLHRVVACLLPQDAELVWSHLIASATQPGEEALAHLLAICECEGAPPESLSKDALRLLVRMINASNRADEDFWRKAVASVEAFVALASLRARWPPDRWSEIESALIAGTLAMLPGDAYTIAGKGLRHWIDHPALLQRAAGIVSSQSVKARQDKRSTRFGCIFLLLPLIEELPAEAWSRQPELLKFAVFVRCCAPEARPMATADPLLRELFTVPAGGEPDEVAAPPAVEVWNWLRETGHAAAEMPLDSIYLAGDDAIAVASHAVLRGFAQKLPGFGSSSLRHLWANFLDFRASVDVEPERIVVHMTSPPLQVILRLAGLTSGSYRLPRIDPRPFHLFQEA